jgi:hypothetical protein
MPTRPPRPPTPLITPLVNHPADGLKSDALRASLAAALAGRPADLEAWLSRYGAGAEQKPNLRLAAALGGELAATTAGGRAVERLLTRLADNDAAPDTPEVFMPIAAAYGWVSRLGAAEDDGDPRGVATAWIALGQLAGDERAPVRIGAREALRTLTLRPGGADDLLRAAIDWLEIEDSEARWGTAGVVLELLADRHAVATLDGVEPLLAYVSRVIDEVVTAPRSAERSDGRRRLLMAISGAGAAIAAHLRGGDRGPAWLEATCVEARHPDVRAALSSAILTLRKIATGPGPAVVQRLRQALEGSAKPPRDPTRIRPGTGRGRESRKMK